MAELLQLASALKNIGNVLLSESHAYVTALCLGEEACSLPGSNP